jgi:YidC/Oxa1 family membrane protein insertase
MTLFASALRRWGPDLVRIVAFLAIALVIVAACSPPGASTAASAGAGASAGASGIAGGSPAASAVPTPTPIPTPLYPATLKADPISPFAWAFTPIFQAFFLLLVGLDRLIGDIGIAIIITTLIVRTAMVPLMRRQMVSMRQLQALQPEIKELQRRFKGDRLKQQQAQTELMKERGVSQSGCLMAFLPFLLILPMYQVVREGLTSPDITPMLSLPLIGQVIPLTCNVLSGHPCLQSTIPWLGGVDAASYQVIGIPIPFIGTFGLSLYAVFYTLIQLVASRLALPKHDPNVQLDQSAQSQRTMSLVFPFITLLYGNIIPVGLFLYLIVSTAYQAIQQFLTTGWGSLFPLFGWTPAFAVDHKPRFPVPSVAASKPTTNQAGASAKPKESPKPSSLDRSASANATIRQRGRQGRRGRRR